MMNLMRTFFLCIMLLVALPSDAQGAGELPMKGVPSIVQHNDELICGVKITWVRARNEPGQRILVTDATIHHVPQHKAMFVSFSAYDYLGPASSDIVSIQESVASNRARPVKIGWFGLNEHGQTKPIDGITPLAEPTDKSFYRTSNPHDIAILEALLSGKPIEVGMRLQESDSDLVQTGVVRMNRADMLKVKSCLEVAMGILNK
jgi:hypothetical protein